MRGLRASGSRCGTLAAGSLSLRLGLVCGPPCGPALALAPLQAPLLAASALWDHAAARSRPGRFHCDSGWSAGRPAALRSPSLRSKLPCSRPPRFGITLRTGRTAGSTRRHKLHILSPAFGQGAVVTLCLLLHKKPLRWAFYGNLNPTPGRPGPACGRPWALPIRSGVCLPCAPVLRASCCHAAAAAQRAAVPTPFVPSGHFPLTGGIGPTTRNTNTRALALLGLCSSLRSIRAAPLASALLLISPRPRRTAPASPVRSGRR